MAVPMAYGLLAVLGFSLVDTYFVSLLGTQALAAISFTFPVTFFVSALAMGLGTGLSACLARLLGQGQHQDAARLTSDGLLLALTTILTVAIIGINSIEPLFKVLGATESLMVYIQDYMFYWYIAIPFLVIPMVGNAAIRATGDTKTPSRVMIIAGFMNGILDPLLIFGIGPFPELGVKGAAIASGLSWLITFAVAIYLLRYREQLLLLTKPNLGNMLKNWRKITAIGLPASLTNMLSPVNNAFVMWQLAAFSTTAVAAYGAGTRLEAILLIGMIAVSSMLSPFIAQNSSANNPQRCLTAIKLAIRYSLISQLSIYLLIALAAPYIATLFSDDVAVISHLSLYLYIIPATFAMQGIMMAVASSLNGFNRPISALSLSLSRSLLIITLSSLGAHYCGEKGIFFGIASANVLVGLLALYYAQQLQLELHNELRRETPA
ncbi:Na(+) driven multidrug efflux pump [Moritella viscosa]|uniref:Na(+) driven multidrug efflux pump n=2 Tax=Moritella viscosa TaxID=80854 RepID=A0A1K9YJH8_9GAMM|nr:Na(+) driven multidrug efflux pump [Moritella viscosa]SHN96068.1 Na(+) driven multidrug efflux pump [Moritella viscosa]SHN96074.1 Na(+) driven multidrug efflux pump [Moritella viscosa]SHN96183.1 Na(+) driven multidrug efflux pump [Moritella viscosa]SHN96333.1 Na(+) driven multidrug efflux pump [Moritella viscosa]